MQYKSEEQERKQKGSRAQNRQGRRRNKKKITVSETIKKNHKIFLMITEKNKERWVLGQNKYGFINTLIVEV